VLEVEAEGKVIVAIVEVRLDSDNLLVVEAEHTHYMVFEAH